MPNNSDLFTLKPDSTQKKIQFHPGIHPAPITCAFDHHSVLLSESSRCAEKYSNSMLLEELWVQEKKKCPVSLLLAVSCQRYPLVLKGEKSFVCEDRDLVCHDIHMITRTHVEQFKLHQATLLHAFIVREHWCDSNTR